jgi:hypothetical protein
MRWTWIEKERLLGRPSTYLYPYLSTLRLPLSSGGTLVISYHDIVVKAFAVLASSFLFRPLPGVVETPGWHSDGVVVS